MGKSDNMPADKIGADNIDADMGVDLDALEQKHAYQAQQLLRLERLAALMDARFTVPFMPKGLKFSLGLDALIGLIPVIGDSLGLAVSAYITIKGRHMGLSKRQLIPMIFNVFIDWLFGLIPLLGDLFDMGWRANLRNVDYIRQIIEKTQIIDKTQL